MNIWEEQKNITRMKNNIARTFGLESKKTIDFFFKCDIMNYEDIKRYFNSILQLKGVSI